MALKMRWTDHGGSGPTLLLVHGFLMSQAQWQPNIAALRQVCRPVTVDLWGHGASPAPTQAEWYRPERIVAELDSIRAALEIERWLLCGYSLGGALTLRYALSHPERVIAHAFTNSTSALADGAMRAKMRQGQQRQIQQLRTEGSAALRKIAVHPRFATRIAPDLLAPILLDAEKLSAEGVAFIMSELTPAASVRTEVGSNQRPLLLICGTEEQRFQPFRDYAETQVPQLTIAELAVGHAVNLEDVDGFNQQLCQFIEAQR